MLQAVRGGDGTGLKGGDGHADKTQGKGNQAHEGDGEGIELYGKRRPAGKVEA